MHILYNHINVMSFKVKFNELYEFINSLNRWRFIIRRCFIIRHRHDILLII